jgi:hypothetical protein
LENQSAEAQAMVTVRRIQADAEGTTPIFSR